ncbi:MAG TPA: glucose-6-phosphate dehydrogenase [Candidatus Acidoferrales bacterium]|nr:glucose-6-phosphate dehydrogenase [Candidatus Acidoferrales bacterium]
MASELHDTQGQGRNSAGNSEGKAAPQKKSPCIMVIFGAMGDLTKRKLLPSLCNLAREKLMSDNFAVVGFSRAPMTHEEFREKQRAVMDQFATDKLDPALGKWLVERLYYASGNFDDPEAYRKLAALLAQLDGELKTNGNYFFYLATAPEFFSVVSEQLAAVGLLKEENGSWRRVIVEKPFGRDLESAKSLNRKLLETMREEQIYRIDHYLGKETVQNILVFRFSNGIFEPIWNRRYIKHVEITVAETVGVETRGGYYETSGALRDMVPNHIFQLVTLIAMEPPISFDADAVRDEQTKILRAIPPYAPEEVLSRTARGQYGEGAVGGKQIPAYRSEAKVSPTSNVQTYVAMKLAIDNWRWADVPIYLRTGKALPKRVTEIAIHFRRAPFVLFRHTAIENLMQNRLILHIQPDEGISLRFGAKVPGPTMKLGAVDMDFSYAGRFGSTHSTGYERLIYDCMAGDATLFQRADMVEAAWGVVQPVLDVWQALPPRNFPNYPAGTWGPREADDLLARDERRWTNE